MAYTTIDDPSAHFQVETYTGAGANTSVTFSGNSDLKPDFLWLKNRTAGYAHAAFDSNRNLGSAVNAPFLEPNDTGTENSNQNWWNATNYGINTDGFQFGSVSEHNLNNLGSEYVAWAWKANGGTTSSNTDGSITSTVQANQDAGFSIVTWAGTNSTATIGHGLGVAPKFIIVRARDKGVPTSWIVFHKDGSTSDDDYYILQGTFAKGTQAGIWNNQYPSSTVFGVANDFWVNSASTNYLAYCFAEKQGYSKFGKYVGNGNADGTFVYTGFKPAWVMTKEVNATGAWVMYDNKRSTTANPQDKYFSANTVDAEATFTQYDFVSNGFKFRTSGSENSSGNTHIYMAFAENPFVTSTGIPTTAR